MAEGVEVNVTDRAVITALNTPGGAVYEWRDRVMVNTVANAVALSPVGNPADALTRGGVVGRYKAGWRSRRTGSNGNRVRAVIFNNVEHATVVEYGRSPSASFQSFSTAKFAATSRSAIHRVTFTAGRAGKHVLQRAVDQTRAEMGF